MAVVYKCDGCGALMEKDARIAVSKRLFTDPDSGLSVEVRAYEVQDGMETCKPIDLCPECVCAIIAGKSYKFADVDYPGKVGTDKEFDYPYDMTP